ncbi:MAG: 30S ribosomal protein S2 [bacterium]|nr:30S ribosomal protein S2 [bacterium]
MSVVETTKETNPQIEALFKAGAHFGYSKSRRHPSASPYIFGAKNRVEIFDLEATSGTLNVAKEFIRNLGRDGKTILLISGKSEGKNAIKDGATAINMPYVAGRFIGGTLTNFPQIRKRIDKLEKLLGERESGELNRYTKKERLLIDRDIDRLTHDFGGIVSLKQFPSALVLIDPKREHNAVKEAQRLKIPIVALANSDCNLREVAYPVPGNDSLKKSVEFFIGEIVSAYQEGKKTAAIVAPAIIA